MFMRDLKQHPIFEATDPTRGRSVRISAPSPKWLNPFWKDGVVIRAAGIPGELPHSKFYVARELLLGGILDGSILPGTTIVEATSGNTGDGLALFCKALGLPVRLIISAGTVGWKVDKIRVMGSGVEVVLDTIAGETTVERARREGKLEGHYNPDQYANPLNPLSHKKYLAPQLFKAAEEITLLAVASGTMGTSMGLKQYAEEQGLPTYVLAVILEEKEEVPGIRSLSKIKHDIRQPWKNFFTLEDLEFVKRHESFLTSFYSWRWVLQSFGPSYGSAHFGALKRLYKAKRAGTLDRYRSKRSGMVEVVVLGADTNAPYLDLFSGELKAEERHTDKEPDLLSLLAA